MTLRIEDIIATTDALRAAAGDVTAAGRALCLSREGVWHRVRRFDCWPLDVPYPRGGGRPRKVSDADLAAVGIACEWRFPEMASRLGCHVETIRVRLNGRVRPSRVRPGGRPVGRPFGVPVDVVLAALARHGNDARAVAAELAMPLGTVRSRIAREGQPRRKVAA